MKQAVILLLILFVLVAVIVIIFLMMGVDRQTQNQRLFLVGEARIWTEVADTYFLQIAGLSNRESLCDACGMVFIYPEPRPQSFVMRDMRFPLDFIFIREGRVTEIFENIPHPQEPGEEPRKIQSRAPADKVLEVNAGFVQKYQIRAGDRAVFANSSN